MKHLSCIAILYLLCTVQVFSQSVAQTNDTVLGTIDRYEYTWISSTGGVATATTTPINGELKRVVFDPDGGGTTPDNDYDVTLLDGNNIDVFAGQGADLTNGVEVSIVPGEAITDGTTTSVIPFAIKGTLDLSISNAGSENGGVIVLYVRP